MLDLRELYQSLILDHGRTPRNFSVMADADRVKEGFNPLCGDRLTLFLKLQAATILDISFQGCGCAISMASTSLMTEYLKGKSAIQANEVFVAFHEMITKGKDPLIDLGKLCVLKGVFAYPARVKCATLAWHTLMGALHNNPDPVSTE